jgi:hypothetical protein
MAKRQDTQLNQKLFSATLQPLQCTKIGSYGFLIFPLVAHHLKKRFITHFLSAVE